MAKKPKIPLKAPILQDKDIGDFNALAAVAQKRSKIAGDELVRRKTDMEARKEKDMAPIQRPNAKKWIQKIRRSEKVRKVFRDDSERYMRMYQGDYSTRSNGKKRTYDSMSVNIVYSHIEIMAPAIFSGQPVVKVRPKPRVGVPMDQAETTARNMELVLAYWAKELAADSELRDVLHDTFFGFGITELGWETVIEDREEETLDKDDAEVELPPVITLVDRPFITRIDPWMTYFDPDAKRRRDVRWIAIEEVISYNEFQANNSYTPEAKKKIKPSVYPDSPETEKNWIGRDEDRSDREWVQIYTIWEKDTKKKFVVSKGYEGYLNTDDPAGEDWPYEIDYRGDIFPICVHDAKRDRKAPYTWSEFKAYEPQIVELNRIRTAMQIHVKRTMPKYIFTQAAGGREKISKLMNARSDEATELDNLDAIRAFENAPIPPDLWNFNNTARDDLTNVSGISEFQNESLAKTATEANIMQGNSQIRKSARSTLWEQYVVEIFAKLAQLCQQNMDEALAVQIAGPQGIEWLQVSKDDIQGDFYFEIEPGAMEYKNEAIRQQQLLKFLELTNGDPNVNRRALIAKIAKELDLTPEEVIIPQNQIPGPPPPPPELKFKPIDLLDIKDSGVLNMAFVEALRQNGVNIPPGLDQMLGAAPPGGLAPPGGPDLPHPGPGAAPGASSGKNIASNGMSPNGGPGAPVSGNLHPGGNQ